MTKPPGTEDFPPEWDQLSAKASQVERINPQAIQGVADQYVNAAGSAADHSAQLSNAANALRENNAWTGPDADAFFGKVAEIGAASQRVKDRLDEVGAELGRLQQTLTDIKAKIKNEEETAKKAITDANTKAKTTAADLRAAMDNGTWHPPMNTPEQVLADNKQAVAKIAKDAETRIDDLLRQADEAIKKAQQLMQREIDGGFSTVGVTGPAATAAASSGPLHSNGSAAPSVGGSSGGGGGGGGGGSFGGLGPSGGPPASGPPPGNVDQWIREAIKILQQNGIPVTEADINKIWTIIEKESGGNPHAINNWDCVPLDTMALTRRGWLKHDEVRTGDETIGYNPATGRSEWTRVTRVVHHRNAPLLRLRNSRWHATTTPNHRWLAEPVRESRPLQRESRVLPGTKTGLALRVPGLASEIRFVTTEAIGEDDRLLLATPPTGELVTEGLLTLMDAGRADVWCVTTEFGTWTAREDEHVFLTGNSNAAAGTPSKGLMQCIDPTFNAHKLPGHDDIYNPVDNIIAGVRYTFDRYGGFDGHPGLKSMAGGGGYQGY